MTANQLVAYNLRRAREERDMTQDQLARELEPYIGKRWSVANLSALESSAGAGGRTREFDANQLLAFSRVFDKPIGWFFTPPDGVEHVYPAAPLDAHRPVHREELLESISGSTLWDRVVMAEQVTTLRKAADALEEVISTREAGERTEEKEENDA